MLGGAVQGSALLPEALSFVEAIRVESARKPFAAFLARISLPFSVWSQGDHRDWEAIRTWAEELRPMLASSVDEGKV